MGIGDWLSFGARQFGVDTSKFPTWGQAVEAVTTPPDTYDAAGRAVNDFQQGNYGQAFTGLLGSMPTTGALKVKPQIGYHGSGASFSQFDLSKALSGEGRQAFGAGVYLGNTPETALTYRNLAAGEAGDVANNLLASSRRSPTGHIDPRMPVSVDQAIADAKQKIAALRDGTRGSKDPAAEIARFQDAIGVLQNPPGHAYEVQYSIPSNRMLDLSKKLSGQPDVIKEIVAGWKLDPLAWTDKMPLEQHLSDYVDKIAPAKAIEQAYKGTPNIGRNGAWLGSPEEYKAAMQKYGAPAQQAVTNDIRDAGFDAIRYKFPAYVGAMARGDKHTVIFNPDHAKIIRQYGFAPAAGLGLMNWDQNQQ